jgi:disulfide bond formation protein DsbB
MANPLSTARTLALVTPLALLGGAYAFQYWGGLFPCELCWWQRYGHFAALALAAVSFGAPRNRTLVQLAGLALAVSALIGAYHSGIEYRWWQGFTACTSAVKFGGGDPLDAIMAAPNVRCDEVQWKLFGISLAGYNFLVSGAAALAVMALASRRKALP